MKLLLPIAAIILLSACTAIPVKTLYKLATADFMTVDPAVLRVAAQMPDWVAPRPDGVKLELGMKREGEMPVNERFNLEAIPLALEGKALTDAAKPGYQLYAYRLAPVDIPRLQHFRDNPIHNAKGVNWMVSGVRVARLFTISACPSGSHHSSALDNSSNAAITFAAGASQCFRWVVLNFIVTSFHVA